MDELTEEQIRAEAMPETLAKNKYADFYLEAEPDTDATIANGYPTFNDVPYIRVRNKGEADYVAHKADAEEKRIWHREWAAFEARVKNLRTPLKALPTIMPSHVRTLEALGFRTVQELAVGSVPDALSKWKDYALRYMRITEKPRLKLVDGAFIEQ